MVSKRTRRMVIILCSFPLQDCSCGRAVARHARRLPSVALRKTLRHFCQHLIWPFPRGRDLSAVAADIRDTTRARRFVHPSAAWARTMGPSHVVRLIGRILHPWPALRWRIRDCLRARSAAGAPAVGARVDHEAVGRAEAKRRLLRVTGTLGVLRSGVKAIYVVPNPDKLRHLASL